MIPCTPEPGPLIWDNALPDSQGAFTVVPQQVCPGQHRISPVLQPTGCEEWLVFYYQWDSAYIS